MTRSASASVMQTAMTSSVSSASSMVSAAARGRYGDIAGCHIGILYCRYKGCENHEIMVQHISMFRIWCHSRSCCSRLPIERGKSPNGGESFLKTTSVLVREQLRRVTSYLAACMETLSSLASRVCWTALGVRYNIFIHD